MSDSPRVIVTRSPNQASRFSQKLEQAGFTPVEFPTIQLIRLETKLLDSALARLPDFTWLIFTSGNAVEFFLQRVDELQIPLARLPKVAVVGSATAARLEARQIPIGFMPEEFVGTELVLGLGDLRNEKILLPRAKIGRPEIVDLLKMNGAEVTEVPLYDTVTAVATPEAFAALDQKFAAITFTSPSSVRNFFKIITANPQALQTPIENLLQEAIVVCIGPETAAAAAKEGLHSVLIPHEYTIDGLVRLLGAALPLDP